MIGFKFVKRGKEEMKFLDLVKKRESTRKYSSKPVSREMIDMCLEAARLAPSACNSQPWSFIVIDDERKKNEVAEAAASGIYNMTKWASQAPVLIVIVTEKSKYSARLGTMIRGVKYNLIDIGITGQHIALQAAELGLGTCWLGWFNEKKLKKTLGLPKSKQIDIIMTLGYAENEGEPPREKIRSPLDEIRTYYTPGSNSNCD